MPPSVPCTLGAGAGFASAFRWPDHRSCVCKAGAGPVGPEPLGFARLKCEARIASHSPRWRSVATLKSDRAGARCRVMTCSEFSCSPNPFRGGPQGPTAPPLAVTSPGPKPAGSSRGWSTPGVTMALGAARVPMPYLNDSRRWRSGPFSGADGSRAPRRGRSRAAPPATAVGSAAGPGPRRTGCR